MPAFGDRLSHQEIIAVLTYVEESLGDKTKRGLSIRESQALASEEDPFPPGGVRRLAVSLCLRGIPLRSTVIVVLGFCLQSS